MKDLLITICARGGSKGIPGKNIKLLNRKPLLHYTLILAQRLQSRLNADIQISTDSENILECAGELGYKTSYKRPEIFATDKAGKLDAIRDAMRFAEKENVTKYEYVLDLDVTSPMRTEEDIIKAMSLLKSNKEALNIFSVNHAARNPYFNMVEEAENGFVRVVKDAGLIKSRQAAPKVYDMNASFYIFKRAFFEENHQISTTDKSLAYVMDHICFDLDELHDFTIMEIMLREELLNFTF
ncbi:MAG: CMP-N,N'-diacetyllegionaminic acid synthase [Algoriphagus sp.]|jgi:CMP-N-acetylneuraminic acid synthetase